MGRTMNRLFRVMVFLCIGVSLFIWGAPTGAQSADSTVFLDSNTPFVLRLGGDGHASTAVFDGLAGQVVTVAAQSVEAGALDTVLELVTSEDERLAYSDDWAGGREGVIVPAGLPSDLAPTDAAVVRVALPADGRYTVRVNTFNGEGTGEVRVWLAVDVPDVLTVGEAQSPVLRAAEVRYFTLELAADQTVTLTLAHPRGRLDPLLTVSAADGDILAENDDHGTPDPALNLFDSRLTFTAPADGVYTVAVREFLGRAGVFTLRAE